MELSNRSESDAESSRRGEAARSREVNWMTRSKEVDWKKMEEAMRREERREFETMRRKEVEMFWDELEEETGLKVNNEEREFYGYS